MTVEYYAAVGMLVALGATAVGVPLVCWYQGFKQTRAPRNTKFTRRYFCPDCQYEFTYEEMHRRRGVCVHCGYESRSSICYTRHEIGRWVNGVWVKRKEQEPKPSEPRFDCGCLQ